MSSCVDYPDFQLYLVTPHDYENDPIVSLEEMKEHLRVDFDDEDDLIEGLTLAVTDYLDGAAGHTQRALLDQTWDLKLSSFPAGPIEIPLPPLIEVLSISYSDSDGVAQTFDLDNVAITGTGGTRKAKIYLSSGSSWPTVETGNPEPVVVRFRAGHLDASVSPPANTVPRNVVQAIKLSVANFYENRESNVVGTVVSKLPDSVDMLLRGFLVYG